jgi:hypothetical protein
MNQAPGFLHHALLGLLLSAAGGVLFFVLAPLLGGSSALRSVLALVALACLLHLLAVSRERAGRVLTPLLWLIGAALLWAMQPPLALFALAHAGGLWLIRSLYHHPGPLAALLDLGLTGLAFATALWATDRTGSLFLTLWCFFLIQALFVLIPPAFPRATDPTDAQQDRFRQASRTAEAVLRNLAPKP